VGQQDTFQPGHQQAGRSEKQWVNLLSLSNRTEETVKS